MNDIKKTNEYALAGWLAITAGAITLPMFVLGFGLEIISKRAPEIISLFLVPYLLLSVLHTIFSIYAFLRFKRLLNKKHDFHEVDGLITAIVIGVIIIALLAYPGKVLTVLGIFDLQMTLIFVVGIIMLAVVTGILSLIFAIKLLNLNSNLNGYLKPYCYVTIVAAACFMIFIAAPLGLLLDAAGNVILGLIFLKPDAKEQLPEFV